MDVVELAPSDADAAVALWRAVGLTRPWNDPHADFARAVSGPSSAVLGLRETEASAHTARVTPAQTGTGDGSLSRFEAGEADAQNHPARAAEAGTENRPLSRLGDIAGTAMVGHDGHRGWVYYLAVSPAVQGTGLGRRLMDACEAWLIARGVPKIQFMVRTNNAAVLAFYERLGYPLQDVAVLGRRLD